MRRDDWHAEWEALDQEHIRKWLSHHQMVINERILEDKEGIIFMANSRFSFHSEVVGKSKCPNHLV